MTEVCVPECFWYEPIDKWRYTNGILIPRTLGHFHRICNWRPYGSVEHEDAVDYVSICDLVQEDFYYPYTGKLDVPCFGSIEDAINSGEIPCIPCFKLNNPVLQRSLQKRKSNLDELLKTFTTQVRGEDRRSAGNCPECNKGLLINDSVTSGGETTYFIPLSYCLECGFYSVGSEEHTTDY